MSCSSRCLISKPAPDPYLAAVARSGLPAGRCLAIEDAPLGLAAARAATLDCWVIPTGLTQRATFPGATRVLDRINDVSALLLAAAPDEAMQNDT
jgi:beta-phosphoglucomutase-like phosphatase (HAD superfamily)